MNKEEKSNIIIRYCIEYDYPYNFGDGINLTIFEYFLNSKIISECCFDGSETKIYENQITILGIGSIIQLTNINDFVYGSGVMNLEFPITRIPKKIISVRGPLTRKFLLEKNIDCPEIYGDPALLLPFIYYPFNIKKIYKLGIIPHYMDKKNVPIEFLNQKDIKILDIQSSNNYEQFVNDILSCEKIISSSLHGIIVGDAYNIPSYPCEISKINVEGVKFLDYYLSVNRDFYSIKMDFEINNIIKQMIPYKCKIDIKTMINIFPFIDENIKKICIDKLKNGFLDYFN